MNPNMAVAALLFLTVSATMMAIGGLYALATADGWSGQPATRSAAAASSPSRHFQ